MAWRLESTGMQFELPRRPQGRADGKAREGDDRPVCLEPLDVQPLLERLPLESFRRKVGSLEPGSSLALFYDPTDHGVFVMLVQLDDQRAVTFDAGGRQDFD